MSYSSPDQFSKRSRDLSPLSQTFACTLIRTRRRANETYRNTYHGGTAIAIPIELRIAIRRSAPASPEPLEETKRLRGLLCRLLLFPLLFLLLVQAHHMQPESPLCQTAFSAERDTPDPHLLLRGAWPHVSFAAPPPPPDR